MVTRINLFAGTASGDCIHFGYSTGKQATNINHYLQGATADANKGLQPTFLIRLEMETSIEKVVVMGYELGYPT